MHIYSHSRFDACDITVDQHELRFLLQPWAYNVSPVRDATAPVLGSLVEATVTFVGEETITTPAGTFETLHSSNGFMDIWSTKHDRILVLQQIKSLGLEYVLMELETGPD